MDAKTVSVIILALLLIFTIGFLLPRPTDWAGAFQPAALALLRGEDVYAHPVFNPPWAIAPLIPLALLPQRIGWGFLFTINLLLFAFIAYRLGGKPLAVAVFLVSPPVIGTLEAGNLDGFVLLSVVLPPTIGLFFAFIKPQVGALLALYWLVQAWQAGGWRRVVHTFAPVTLAFLVSFALFGPWPLKAFDTVDYDWNVSLWPRAIPLGLVLLVYAFREHNAVAALAASPLLSPYHTLTGWIGPLAVLVPYPVYLAAAVIGFWIAVLF